MPKYKSWFDKIKDEPTTRERSGKQESKLAKVLKGKTFINSGATFSQNDLQNDYAEVEAKTTSKNSYSLNMNEWDILKQKCNSFKIPIFIVQFEKRGKSLATLDLEDLLFIVEQANGNK